MADQTPRPSISAEAHRQDIRRESMKPRKMHELAVVNLLVRLGQVREQSQGVLPLSPRELKPKALIVNRALTGLVLGSPEKPASMAMLPAAGNREARTAPYSV